MPYPPPWMTSTVVLPVRFSRAPARVCSVPMTACAPLPVAMPPMTTLDRVVEMMPDLVDKVEKYFDKKEEKEPV